MAKKSKGEVAIVTDAGAAKRETSFVAAGKTYTMVFSINALCELESDFDDVVGEVAAVLAGTGKKRITVMRKVFRAGLSDHHPEVTEKEAGAIMTAIGPAMAFAKVAEAFTLAFPPTDGGDVPLDIAAAA
jgi:hypothetical protein